MKTKGMYILKNYFISIQLQHGFIHQDAMIVLLPFLFRRLDIGIEFLPIF